VAAIVRAYANWLAATGVPKLFVKGEPGAILSQGAAVEECRRWPAQTEVRVRHPLSAGGCAGRDREGDRHG
jgi:haloalkane dehalogenase